MIRYSRYSRYRTKSHDKTTISHDITRYSRYQTVLSKLQEIISTCGRNLQKCSALAEHFCYLLDELRCSYIRLRRVILLCSCIRLVPSGIRFASFWGEYNITVRIICKANLRTISLRARQVISLRSNITIYNHDLL